MSEIVVKKVFGRPMKISTIFAAVKNSGEYYNEEPQRIWIGRSTYGLGRPTYGLASSLAGVIYVILVYGFDRNLTLKIDGKIVARGNIEIFLWVLENAPVSYRAGVKGLIAYEKESDA